MSEEWRDELVTKGAVVDALKDNMFRLTLAEEQRCEGHVVWDEDVVFADVLEKALLALQPAQPQDIARDIATIVENEKDMRVVLNQQRWIPVTKAMPDEHNRVLILTDDGTIFTGDHNEYWEDDYEFEIDDVIAWMPLPEPWKNMRGEEDEAD